MVDLYANTSWLTRKIPVLVTLFHKDHLNSVKNLIFAKLKPVMYSNKS